MSWEGIHLTKLFVKGIKHIKSLRFAPIHQHRILQEPSYVNIYKESKKGKWFGEPPDGIIQDETCKWASETTGHPLRNLLLPEG